MKLEKWALIAEIVGSFAIVATLIVLIVESRGNTEAIRASTYQAVVDSITTPLDMRAADSEMARIWNSGMSGEELSENDQIRFRAMLLAAVRRFENAFYQYQLGTIDERQWEVLKSQVQNVITTPGSRDWWQQNRERFSPDFRRDLELAE